MVNIKEFTEFNDDGCLICKEVPPKKTAGWKIVEIENNVLLLIPKTQKNCEIFLQEFVKNFNSCRDDALNNLEELLEKFLPDNCLELISQFALKECTNDKEEFDPFCNVDSYHFQTGW